MRSGRHLGPVRRVGTLHLRHQPAPEDPLCLRIVPFVCASVGAAIAGAVVGLLQIRIYSGGTGIFALANFIDTQTGSMTGVFQMAGCILLGVALSFLLTLVLYRDKDKQLTANDKAALAADAEANG